MIFCNPSCQFFFLALHFSWLFVSCSIPKSDKTHACTVDVCMYICTYPHPNTSRGCRWISPGTQQHVWRPSPPTMHSSFPSIQPETKPCKPTRPKQTIHHSHLSIPAEESWRDPQCIFAWTSHCDFYHTEMWSVNYFLSTVRWLTERSAGSSCIYEIIDQSSLGTCIVSMHSRSRSSTWPSLSASCYKVAYQLQPAHSEGKVIGWTCPRFSLHECWE